MVANVTTGIAYATEGTPAQADHGYFAQRYNDGHWHCWNMLTGQLMGRVKYPANLGEPLEPTVHAPTAA